MEKIIWKSKEEMKEFFPLSMEMEKEFSFYFDFEFEKDFKIDKNIERNQVELQRK